MTQPQKSLRAIVKRLAFCLGEAHAPEIHARHHGDPGGADSCDYCQALREARTYLRRVKAGRAGWETNREGVRMTQCQGCGQRANENRIDPVIKDLWARVEPGEVMPAGECRACRSVVHLIPNRQED